MSGHCIPHYRIPPCFCPTFIAAFTFLVVWLPISNSMAQSITAEVFAVRGNVHISRQGAADVAITKGMLLHPGDIIETGPDAQVTLRLSDGSELHLGRNTQLDIAALTQHPRTNARKSRLKLWYGRIRAILSPGHQEKGSSFTVDTPNARAGVKFSRPEIEIAYHPDTKTTLVIGHTVAITVMNLLTKDIKGMPEGHQAIVYDDYLWISPFVAGAEQLPADWRRQAARNTLFSQSRRIVGGIVSTVPISAGARSETSQSPGPGTSLCGPRPRTVFFNMSEE